MKTFRLIAVILVVVFAVSSMNAQTKSSKAKSKTKTVTEEQTLPTPQPAAKDGLFIQLSSGTDNPQSVLLALSIAMKMADNHDVYLFADLKGPEVFLSKTQTLEMKHFEASKVLIQKLLDKGVTIGVCQTCLELLNQTEFDLMKGIKLANKADFFRFTSGRILSLTF